MKDFKYASVEDIQAWIDKEAISGHAHDPLIKTHWKALATSMQITGFSGTTASVMESLQAAGNSPIQFGNAMIAFGILIGLQIQEELMSGEKNNERVN